MICDEGGGGDHCLICHGLIPRGLSSFDNDTNDKSNKNDRRRKWSSCSLLERHLEVIFLLRKVLQVPVRHLASFLEGSSNVEGWISICEECTELVEECKLVYHQFLEVNSKWLECKSRIVGIIRETGGKEEDVVDLEVIDIGKCTRQFVQKYNYKGWRNPYFDGDQKAKELVKLRRNPEEEVIELIIEDEDDVKEEKTDFYVIPDDYDESMSSNCPSPTGIDIGSNGDDLVIQPAQKEATSPPTTSKKVIRTIRNKPVGSRKSTKRKNKVDDVTRTTTDVSTAEGKKVKVPRSKLRFQTNRGRAGPGTSRLPTTCPICKMTIRRLSWLKAHLATAHSIGNLKYSCSQCHKTFPSNWKLQRHQKNCGLPFTRNRPTGSTSGPCNDLVDQIQIKCPVVNCPLSCPTMTTYRHHLNADHNQEERQSIPKPAKILECVQCGKILATKCLAKIHLASHDKSLVTKDTICEICGKAFYTISQLNFHKKTNVACRRLQGLSDSEANVICQLCGKCYANRQTLQKHISYRHHGKLINLVCPMEGCGKIFHDQPGLKRHQMGVHKMDGEPRFKCGECGKAFYTPTSRSQHLRGVHKGWYKNNKKGKVSKTETDQNYKKL